MKFSSKNTWLFISRLSEAPSIWKRGWPVLTLSIPWNIVFHLPDTRCHLWKGQKNEVKNVRFWPHFSPVFCSKTTTSCGISSLFFLPTTIRHHYHRLNMRWKLSFILHGKSALLILLSFSADYFFLGFTPLSDFSPLFRIFHLFEVDLPHTLFAQQNWNIHFIGWFPNCSECKICQVLSNYKFLKAVYTMKVLRNLFLNKTVDNSFLNPVDNLFCNLFL